MLYLEKRATLLSQPENEKVYSLGDYVAVCSETNDSFMCVRSEINDPSKEVKVRFMSKSRQYFLLSKKLKKWFPKSAIFHRCSISSNECNKTKLLILIKNSIACSCVSHKLLMYPIEDNCCKR